METLNFINKTELSRRGHKLLQILLKTSDSELKMVDAGNGMDTVGAGLETQSGGRYHEHTHELKLADPLNSTRIVKSEQNSSMTGSFMGDSTGPSWKTIKRKKK